MWGSTGRLWRCNYRWWVTPWKACTLARGCISLAEDLRCYQFIDFYYYLDHWDKHKTYTDIIYLNIFILLQEMPTYGAITSKSFLSIKKHLLAYAFAKMPQTDCRHTDSLKTYITFFLLRKLKKAIISININIEY